MSRPSVGKGKPANLGRASRFVGIVVTAALLASFANRVAAETIDGNTDLSPQFSEVLADVKAHDAGKLNALIVSTQEGLKKATTDHARAELNTLLSNELINRYQSKMSHGLFGTISDGKGSFHTAQAAFYLEPHDLLFTTTYSRTVRGLTLVPEGKRSWATGILGLNINLEKEIRNVTTSLNEFPDDALAQTVQSQLGTFLGDATIMQRAEANLAHASDKDRAAVAAILAVDDSLAKSASK